MGRPKNKKSDFWKKVTVGLPDECWEWQTGKDKDGYGVFWIDDKSIRAHRFSYKFHYGEIPDDKCVCHHCDNPSCVNPAHLFVGTNIDNIIDKQKKNRCYRPLGEKAVHAKLTDKNVYTIRILCNDGISRKRLSVLFGICKSQIEFIVRGKAWPHVGGPLQETNRRVA